MKIKIFRKVHEDLILGAAASLIKRDEEYLLVQEGNKRCCGKWGLPEGEREKSDMTLADTAVRETFEETGLVFQPTHVVCMSDIECSINGHIFGMVYFGEVTGGEMKAGPEILKVGWFSFKLVKDMYLRNELRGDYVFNVIRHHKEHNLTPLSDLVLCNNGLA